MTDVEQIADPEANGGTPGLSVIDTRERDWDGSGGKLPRVMSQVLATDADGDPVVHMRWMTALHPDPARITNGFRLAHEYYFCVSGEFSHYERGFDSGTDDLIRFTGGVWMDRAAGSLTSGATDVPHTVCGIGWLTDGRNPYVSDRDGVALTVTLDGHAPKFVAPGYDPGREGLRHESDFTTVWETRQMRWEPHPVYPGAVRKTLSGDGRGGARVSLVGINAGAWPGAAETVPGINTAWRGRHRFRRFMYVLDGGLTLTSYAGESDTAGTDVELRQGHWIEISPGTVYGFRSGEISSTGATLFTFDLAEGQELVKERDKYNVWTRTLEGGTSSLAPVASADELRQFRDEQRQYGRGGLA
jgi:hypothetical protein